MARRRTRAVLVATLATILLPVCLQAQYFGRNKVQYRSFDFDIIRTDNFDVYYYPVEREGALDAARMIERSYARLSRVLQHEFRERKPLIVYASHTDFQQTNALRGFIDESTGGVTESLKSRMILPFTGSYADFDHVLTHELVHGFQYDVILRRGIAADAAPMTVGRLPLWFMEGMAEYLSLGQVDALTQAWLRDAVLSGYIRSIDEMSQRDDYLSYRFGQSLWAYIGSKWGDEVVGILLQKAPRVGLDRAFASTLGVALEELSAEWLEDVRKTYLPQVAQYQNPHSFAQRITTHDDLGDPWFLSPALSPDGSQLVYLSQRDGFFLDLWLADARTGKVTRRLIEAASSADFESLRYMGSSASFSPDGRYVAFAAQTGGMDALYIYDLRARRIVRKMKFELNAIANPTWAPDGSRLAFTGNDGGLSDLFVTTLDGELQRLTRDRYADLHPAWSPDGSTIAFSTDRGPGTSLTDLTYGNMRVALYRLDDGAIDILPHQHEGKNINPVWSPDGRQLIWVSDRTGTNDLYLFDRDSSRLSRITELLSGAIATTPLSPVLSWSRSGRLAFNYFEEAGYNIYTVEDPRELPRMAVVSAPPVLAVEPATVPSAPEPTGPSAAQAELPPVSLAGASSFYRGEDGFRPSDLSVAPARAGGPISVIALLDSAELALPDTLAFEHRDYRVKFTPDVVGRPTIGAQVGGHYGNGLYGGSYISLSDMLGNHNIVVAGNLNGSFSDAAFYSAYSFLKPRSNLGVAIMQQPLYRYLGGGDAIPVEIDGERREIAANVFTRDLVRSAQATMTYPFSTYRRLELGAGGYAYQTDLLYRGYDVDSGDPLEHDERLDRLAFWQPQLAMVFDNSLFGWTGPIYGQRYRLQISRTLGDLQFTEALLDFRKYLNYEQKAVFALRAVGLARIGGNADRLFRAYWGGPYFLRGYDGGSYDASSQECQQFRSDNNSRSQCPVRDQLIGSSAAIVNAELRVPVIKELQIGLLGSFPPVDAVAFFDGGLAWMNELCTMADPMNIGRCADGAGEAVRVVWRRQPGQDPLLFRAPMFSYGLGLRINVFYTVLRLDYAVPLDRPDRARIGDGLFSFSFGPSF